MVTCISCAKEAPEGSAFCPSCGQKITDDTVTGDSSHASSSVDRGDFAAGTVLAGRYRIVSLTGRGGMGEVYEADDLTLGQVVALKFLPRSLSQDERALHHLLEEVRIARRISHVNVARVYDIGEVDGRRFLTMEFVRGEDLRQLLLRIGRLPSEKALEIAHQICAGLAAAHDQGVLHRDLKPANVMLDQEGKVHLTDFGLAVLAKDHEGEIAGTPAYMAPEQIRGHTLTVRSEVYALGVLLYELFTGKPAFEGQTFDDFARLHQEETPPNPSSRVIDIDPTVERVILQCLEKDPMRRPRSARAVTGNLPGGDPLAAAIAAGQTPAPEVVAAAGSPDLIRPPVLLGLFGLCIGGLLAAILLASATDIFVSIGLAQSPPVLTAKSQELAESLGYEDRPRDWGAWFESPWSAGGTTRDTFVAFQYRQSPRPLAYLGQFLTQNDPAPTVPGMVSLTLDNEGRLRRFSAVPGTDWEGSGAFDWTLLLAEAGFDPTELTETEPRAPPVYAQTRVAWRGTDPTDPERPVRIDAASSGERPVHFEVSLESTEVIDPEEVVTALVVVILPVFFGLQLLAALMAWRNLRLGRGDRRGALRLAIAVFLCTWIGRLFAMYHIPDPVGEFFQILPATGMSLYIAVITWLLYLAFEPYVRRKWPHALIPWTRLLAGRPSDPLVGRDLLVGTLWAFSVVCLGALFRLLPELTGTGSASLAGRDPAFLGLRQAIGAFVAVPATGMVYGLGLLLALVFLRMLAGRYATALCLVIMTVIGTVLISLIPRNPTVAYNAVFAIVFSGSVLFVLIRFGLLAIVVGTTVGNVFWQMPLIADPSSWYFHNTMLTGVLVLGLCAWGLWAALAGRPIFRDELG